MSVGFGRALGVSGWLVAAAAVIWYGMATYDVTIRERGPNTGGSAVAPPERVPVQMESGVVMRYRNLAAQVGSSSGSELLAVDRRLEAAEHEFPSEYSFTYERATLAVYGRAEHHEAFFHLRRAAEKAIRTARAGEMLDRLEQDGAPEGGLRRLAVGHSEWGRLHDALEHHDEHRLWKEHARHVRVSKSTSKGVAQKKSLSASTRQDTHPTLLARMRASSLLASGKPCGAFVALQRVRSDPEAGELVRTTRELCLGGGELR